MRISSRISDVCSSYLSGCNQQRHQKRSDAKEKMPIDGAEPDVAAHAPFFSAAAHQPVGADACEQPAGKVQAVRSGPQLEKSVCRIGGQEKRSQKRRLGKEGVSKQRNRQSTVQD